MKPDEVLERIRKLLGIDATGDVTETVHTDQTAAASGVATKEVDPFALLGDLQTQMADMAAQLAKITDSMSGFARKETVDQALAAGKRSDDVIEQVKQLLAQGATTGTGRKETPVTEEQKKIIDQENQKLEGVTGDPWTAKYEYKGGR